MEYFIIREKSINTNQLSFHDFRLNITSLGPSKEEMGPRMPGEGKRQRGEGEGGRAREGEGEGEGKVEGEEEEGKGGEEEIETEIRRGELKEEQE